MENFKAPLRLVRAWDHVMVGILVTISKGIIGSANMEALLWPIRGV